MPMHRANNGLGSIPDDRKKGGHTFRPKYCRHKASGQAVVYTSGREIHLGEYGSDASWRRYNQVVARLQAGEVVTARQDDQEFTVAELVLQFTAWAITRYSPSEMHDYAMATKRLLRLHADTPVIEFGPLALQAVRRSMIADDLCRNLVGALTHRVRRIWRWGVENELVAETNWRALKAVHPLARGEGGVRESEPVLPARWRQLRAVLRNAPLQVQAMVRIQILTGMRTGELVRLRPGDLNLSNSVWCYRPTDLATGRDDHKTAHLGKVRVIQIGPRARAVLEPWLVGVAPDCSIFDPRRSIVERNARSAAAYGPGGRSRPAAHDPTLRRRRARQRGVKPRRCHDRYTVASYRRAIQRACEMVWPIPAKFARRPDESTQAWKLRIGVDGVTAVVEWRQAHGLHPHQLRHNFATRIAARAGEEFAQKLLGHSRLATTAIYAERDLRQTRPIIAQLG